MPTEFERQLRAARVDPRAYLGVARALAKRHGYAPSKLAFSTRADKKLMLETPEGVRHFGQVHYGDFILYSFQNPKIANFKRDAYLARSAKIRTHGKYAPNALARNILWDA